MVPVIINAMNGAIAPYGWLRATKIQGPARAMQQAAVSRRPFLRFAAILSASHPPASSPMAPTAPTEIADTLLASRRLIAWKRCRNGVWKALMAYMLKLWKMPERMIHHMVGIFSTDK